MGKAFPIEYAAENADFKQVKIWTTIQRAFAVFERAISCAASSALAANASGVWPGIEMLELKSFVPLQLTQASPVRMWSRGRRVVAAVPERVLWVDRVVRP